MNDRIKVLIADDDEAMRRLVRTALETSPDVIVVGEARDGFQSVDLCRQLRPDVILLDLNMPRMDGLEAAGGMKCVHPTGKVIVWSAYSQERLRNEAFAQGIWDYLVKGENKLSDLVAAVHLAARGGSAYQKGASSDIPAVGTRCYRRQEVRVSLRNAHALGVGLRG